MSTNKSPPPPDYRGAAEATAEGDIEAARSQTTANRPDEYSPYGSRTWEQGSGSVFDQQGYDDELGRYNAYRDWYAQTGGEGGPKPEMPTREDYTTIQDPDKWVGTTTLNPEAQKTFDAQQRIDQGLADLSEQGINQMRGIFDTPFSIDGQVPEYKSNIGNPFQYQRPGGDVPQFQGPEGDMPQYGEHRQGVMDAMMGRINRDIERDRGSANSTMAARGIPEQAKAYQREMENIDRKQTDARQQAEISAEQMAGMGYSSALAGRGMQSDEAMNDFLTAMQSRGMSAQEAMDEYNSRRSGRVLRNQERMTDYTTGMDSRRQGIQEAMLQRQTPINEMSAFRTGSQVNMPQFQPYGQQSFTGGPDYSGAANAQGQYDLARSNQGIASNNTLMGGFFDLGAAGIGAYPWGG